MFNFMLSFIETDKLLYLLIGFVFFIIIIFVIFLAISKSKKDANDKLIQNIDNDNLTERIVNEISLKFDENIQRLEDNVKENNDRIKIIYENYTPSIAYNAGGFSKEQSSEDEAKEEKKSRFEIGRAHV